MCKAQVTGRRKATCQIFILDITAVGDDQLPQYVTLDLWQALRLASSPSLSREPDLQKRPLLVIRPGKLVRYWLRKLPRAWSAISQPSRLTVATSIGLGDTGTKPCRALTDYPTCVNVHEYQFTFCVIRNHTSNVLEADLLD